MHKTMIGLFLLIFVPVSRIFGGDMGISSLFEMLGVEHKEIKEIADSEPVAIFNEFVVSKNQLDEFILIKEYGYKVAIKTYEMFKLSSDYKENKDLYDESFERNISFFDSFTYRDSLDEIIKDMLIDKAVMEYGINIDVDRAKKEYSFDALFEEGAAKNYFSAYSKGLNISLQQYVDDILYPHYAKVNARSDFALDLGMKNADEFSVYRDSLFDKVQVEYILEESMLDEKIFD